LPLPSAPPSSVTADADASRQRKRRFDDSDDGDAAPVAMLHPHVPAVDDDSKGKKKRAQRAMATDKSSKGLRHFSMKVCKKVEEKGRTTYNEVADELVKEFVSSQASGDTMDQQYDEKNIRRRVYDALNVLMAMDIISKEKKEIRWIGIPTNAQNDLDVLRSERNSRSKTIAKKKEHLNELLSQQVAFTNLVKRNAQQQQQCSATGHIPNENSTISLPFIVISTPSETVIQCEMSEDRADVFFNFSAPFEIYDDNAILQKLRLQETSSQQLSEIFPEQLRGIARAFVDHGPPRR